MLTHELSPNFSFTVVSHAKFVFAESSAEMSFILREGESDSRRETMGANASDDDGWVSDGEQERPSGDETIWNRSGDVELRLDQGQQGGNISIFKSERDGWSLRILVMLFFLPNHLLVQSFSKRLNIKETPSAESPRGCNSTVTVGWRERKRAGKTGYFVVLCHEPQTC